MRRSTSIVAFSIFRSARVFASTVSLSARLLRLKGIDRTKKPREGTRRHFGFSFEGRFLPPAAGYGCRSAERLAAVAKSLDERTTKTQSGRQIHPSARSLCV